MINTRFSIHLVSLMLVMLVLSITSYFDTLSQQGLLQLIFISNRGGENEIYAMNIDGSNVRLIKASDVGIDSAACSYDGNYVATTHGLDGIQITHVQTLVTTVVVMNQPALYLDVAWSPDGSKIAFSAIGDDGSEIYISNVDGTNIQRLTHSPGVDRMPNWSPNGDKIVFYSERENTTGIFVINADGSGETRLTTNPAMDTQPSWSPDGTQIAFYAVREDETNIYVMSNSGSNLLRLTGPNTSDFNPSWSPDGTMLSFNSLRDGNSEIYIMDANGANPRRVTNNPAGDFNVCWLNTTSQIPPTPTATATSTPTPTATPTATATLPPGSSLITNIVAANGKTYERDTVAAAETLYIDRTYSFVTVPAAVAGQEFIRTANNDKALTTVDFLSFSLTQSASVYVMFDTRYSIPAWLRGWTDTGLNVVATEQNNTQLSRRLYRRDYPVGTVVLGADNAPNTSVMYNVIAVPTTENVVYRIDVGSSTSYTSSAGVVWAADGYVTGGVTNSFPNAITNTADDALYTTERSTSAYPLSFEYALPVTNGTYTVRLHFAEIYWIGGTGFGTPGTGKRVFDVLIEGATVLDNYDITAQVGYLAADIRTFSVRVSDGTLNILLPQPSVNRPSLAALEVIGQ